MAKPANSRSPAPAAKPAAQPNRPASQAVSKINPQSTEIVAAEVMPDFMRGHGGKGTENLSSADIETPRIKLIQATSPEVVERGMAPGSWYHTILEIDLGRELRIVPIYVAKPRYLLWRDIDDGGGILARADDGVHWQPASGSFKVKINKATKEVVWNMAKTVQASGLADWGSYDPADPNSPPAANYMLNVVCCFPDFPQIGPAVLTFQRSSLKPGKRFMGKLKLAEAPSYGMVFDLSSVPASNAKNQSYLAPSIVQAGFVQDQEDFRNYVTLYERFEAEGLRIRDEDELQGEAREVEDTPTEGDGKDY